MAKHSPLFMTSNMSIKYIHQLKF